MSNGMIKVPKGLIDERFIKKALRVKGEAFDGDVIVDCWQDEGENWLVPRQWALSEGLPVSVPSNVPAKWGKFAGKYRENQKEAITDCVAGLSSHYGGRLSAPVGTGKTIMACSVCSELQTKTLVIVHKTDLIEQWQSCAKEHFKVKSGIIMGDKYDISNPLTIAMVQTLHRRYDKFDYDFWNSFGLVLSDEAHRAPAATFDRVINSFNSRYKFGVSATWRRSDKTELVWNWSIGPVLHTFKKSFVGEYWQQSFSGPFHDKKYMLHGGMNMNHSAYVTAISKDASHNLRLLQDISKARQAGRKILVVGERTEQLKKLKSKTNFSALYLGESSKKELDDAKKAKVIFGTRGKIGEGSDIPELDTLFLVTPMGDVEQIVGRVCREKEGKKPILVVDLHPNTPYNNALASKRRKIYESMGLSDKRAKK